MPCILRAWCTDTMVYGHYAFCKIKYKYGDQTDNCDFNFNAVDNSMHGLIIHTIKTVFIVVVAEQGGGVRTLQKCGVNRNQRKKSVQVQFIDALHQN